ncbi:hypothetical protein LMG26858_01944 [Achromobacter anxifer]|uniref:Dephospho-CoA kinase n=1 Tax=Achromobacter anxifer TaxID=1287737 RepID=A0A6S7CMK2_9BURK|nr:hypothetical protein [Achromobacter anxifer]CAB3855565.1 hypothetical protein LMG26858_01944 [Achromobacter anxifer]
MRHMPPPNPLPQYRVIGLVGRAGAGKDTCAAILAETRGFARVAFADALRDEVVQAFSIDPFILSDRSLKEALSNQMRISKCTDNGFIERMRELGEDVSKRRSPREIMRLWGTEYRRALQGTSYWTERTNERVNALFRAGFCRICITDVRYPNEAAYVTASLGGELWRIRRRSSDKLVPTHSSESEIEAIDCRVTIFNDLTLDYLAREVHSALAPPIED